MILELFAKMNELDSQTPVTLQTIILQLETTSDLYNFSRMIQDSLVSILDKLITIRYMDDATLIIDVIKQKGKWRVLNFCFIQIKQR